MKKKNIRPLKLNKKSISNFDTIKLKGGVTDPSGDPMYTCVISCVVCPDPVSTFCNTNTDQVECTLHWSDVCTSREL